MENYIKLGMIGKGSGSNSVFKVKNLINNKEYAMKRIIIDINDKEQNNKNNNEISVFKTIHHQNIIEYIESFHHKNKLCIVMEYAGGGDLQKVVDRHKERKTYIKEGTIWEYFVQLYQALKYVHSKKIIHRDIKCQNIFLTKENKVKLGDFGISKMLKNTFDFCKTTLGTPYFLSPEICSGKKYDYKTDVWMLGCVLFELTTLSKPFKGEDIRMLMINILKKDIGKIPKGYSNDLKFLIRGLLTKDPQLRPSLDDISKYDFMKNIINNAEQSEDDEEVIYPDDYDDVNTANSREFFELNHPHPIKECEEEYLDKSNNSIINAKDSNAPKNLLTNGKKRRSPSCIESQLTTKEINLEISKSKLNDKETIEKGKEEIVYATPNGKPYHKKHYRHKSMILDSKKTVNDGKTVNNTRNKDLIKMNVYHHNKQNTAYYNSNSGILINCTFVKSTPCLQQKSNTKLQFLRRTPQKSINYESDSPELTSFTFESEISMKDHMTN